MKTIQFKQQEFRVPDWAKYITEDVDGWYVVEDWLEGFVVLVGVDGQAIPGEWHEGRFVLVEEE